MEIRKIGFERLTKKVSGIPVKGYRVIKVER
jgi:hypothetical protein